MSDDDVYEERLRQVLHGEGSSMDLGDDGLGKIMSKAHNGGSSRRRPGWLAPLAVAAAAVVLLGGVALVVNLNNSGNDDVIVATSGSPTTSVSATAPLSQSTPATSTPTSSAPSSSSAPAVVTQNLAVYYAADVPGVGTRLYREFHSLQVERSLTGAPEAALAELFGGNAVDPDYSSLWPSGTQVRTLTIEGDLATVDVTDFPSGPGDAKQLAIQQLVWTVTAADTSVKRVQVKVNTEPPKGPAVLGEPARRANALETLANVWILAPTEGSTTTSPVTVSVYGTGFEGNVPIKVFKDDGSTQVAATALTTQMGAFAEARTTIKLPPGSYVIKAYNDNGKNGTLQLWDTKTFTVS
jgi:uncharacterized protein (DUF2141 family)